MQFEPRVISHLHIACRHQDLGQPSVGPEKVLIAESIDEAGLIAFLKERIAGFKVPEKIWFEADNLPRLGTEKIDKVSLRAKYRAAWQEAART